MIVARDVGLVLDGRTILEGLSFTIARGESVALVGPNGSGKTSVLRCLLGFVPFTGRLTVAGHDVVQQPIAARSLVGYVAQQAAFGDVRAIDVMRFIAKLRRIDRARIVAMLTLVGLTAHANDRVRTFSGGMRQRLALAAALLPDPPVLFFDEPTANLDREGQRLFHDIVLTLRHERRTLLLASHRTEEVVELTDRTLPLDAGRLPETGARSCRVLPFPTQGEWR